MIAKQAAEDSDIVFGSRYIERGGIYGWNFNRKLTSRVGNFITTQLLGVEVSDFTNSFRLYKRKVFEDLLTRVESHGFGFQMEIIVRATWKNYKISEIPIVFVDRIYGSSKLGSDEIYLFLKGIWGLFNTKH